MRDWGFSTKRRIVGRKGISGTSAVDFLGPFHLRFGESTWHGLFIYLPFIRPKIGRRGDLAPAGRAFGQSSCEGRRA